MKKILSDYAVGELVLFATVLSQCYWFICILINWYLRTCWFLMLIFDEHIWQYLTDITAYHSRCSIIFYGISLIYFNLVLWPLAICSE